MRTSLRKARSSQRQQARRQFRLRSEMLEPRMVLTGLPGLPQLHSLPTAPYELYIDFNNGSYSGTNYGAYNRPGSDAGSFDSEEASQIIKIHKEVSEFFSMFNVDVTTVNGNNAKQRSWVLVGYGDGSGQAVKGSFGTPTSPQGHAVPGEALDRVSCIVHELGHTLGLAHISRYDSEGITTPDHEYDSATSPDFDSLHGSIMGADWEGVIKKWSNWHIYDSLYTLQDDLATIAGKLGYRADDFSGTISGATAMTSNGVGGFNKTGVIEGLADLDAFFFTPSTAGRYTISAARAGRSGVDLTLSVYNAAGTLVAQEDGDSWNAGLNRATVNDQYVTMDLTAQKYTIIVGSHSNYADLGQYEVRVDYLPDPSNWNLSSEPIGQAGKAGYAYGNSTTLLIAASGRGIADYRWWDSQTRTDDFQYVYQKLGNNGTVQARLSGFTANNGNSWIQAGLVIREKLTSGSKSVALLMNADGRAWFASRNLDNVGTQISGEQFLSTPYYLKLSRSTSTFTAQISSDGINWTTIGSTSILMSAEVYIGLSTASSLNQQQDGAYFDSISFTGEINPASAISAQPVPTGVGTRNTTNSKTEVFWNDVSSNETGYQIEVSTDKVNYQIASTVGANVTSYTYFGNEAQPYTFRIRTRDGSGVSNPSSTTVATLLAGAAKNFRVIAPSVNSTVVDWSDASGEAAYRLSRSTDGSTWTNVTGTNNLAKNTRTFAETGSANTTYLYKLDTLNSSNAVVGTTPVVGRWMVNMVGASIYSRAANRIEVRWTAFSGATSYRIERSTDGENFSAVPFSITGTSYVDDTVVSQSEYYYRIFAEKTVGAYKAYSRAQLVFCATLPTDPQGFTSVDIGSVGGAGSSGYSSARGQVIVIGSGSGIGGVGDDFHFHSGPFNATSMSVKAQIVQSENRGTGGIMIRESNASNSKFVYVGMPSHRWGDTLEFKYRSTTGGSVTQVGGFTGFPAPSWVMITRAGTNGDSFYFYGSRDGVAWYGLNFSAVTVSMTSAVRVGFAVTSANNTQLLTTVFSPIDVWTGSSAMAAAPAAMSATTSTNPSPLAQNAGIAPVATATLSSKPARDLALQRLDFHSEDRVWLSTLASRTGKKSDRLSPTDLFSDDELDELLSSI